MKPPYALFVLASASKAINAEAGLHAAGLEAALMAVPRTVSSQCGVCLRVELSDWRRAETVLADAGIAISAVYEVDDRLRDLAGKPADGQGRRDE
jgi:hypothetical protein